VPERLKTHDVWIEAALFLGLQAKLGLVSTHEEHEGVPVELHAAN
jgi:hypothetical protein